MNSKNIKISKRENKKRYDFLTFKEAVSNTRIPV